MVKPIHLQDLFSKTAFAEKVHQVKKQGPETDQHQFNYQLQKQITEEKETTKKLEPKDQMIIHTEEKHKEKHQQEKKKRQKKEEVQEHKKSNDKGSSSHIDIKI